MFIICHTFVPRSINARLTAIIYVTYTSTSHTYSIIWNLNSSHCSDGRHWRVHLSQWSHISKTLRTMHTAAYIYHTFWIVPRARNIYAIYMIYTLRICARVVWSDTWCGQHQHIFDVYNREHQRSRARISALRSAVSWYSVVKCLLGSREWDFCCVNAWVFMWWKNNLFVVNKVYINGLQQASN